MNTENVVTYTKENPYVVASFYCNQQVLDKKNPITSEFSVRFNIPSYSSKTESFLCPNCRRSLKVDLYPHLKKNSKIIAKDTIKIIFYSILASLFLIMILASFWNSNDYITDFVTILKTKSSLIIQIAFILFIIFLIVYFITSNSSNLSQEKDKLTFRQDRMHKLYATETFYYEKQRKYKSDRN